MRTWLVVNDDSGDERRRVRIPRHLARIALLACLALSVVTLGMVLKPGNPPEPQQPPVSERARAAALADTLHLRAAGQLAVPPAVGSAAAAPGAAGAALERTVTLLTTQARALLRPGQASPSATAAPSGTPSPATAAPPPVTDAALAVELAGSGRQRLADAAAVDGGTARLLAAVGTAQLLQSSALAAATGGPDPAAGTPAAGPALGPTAPTAPGAPAVDGAPSASSTAASACPSAAGAADASAAGGPSTAGTADLPGALAALVSTELESVYGYQVALTRLEGGAARTAAEQLARHEAILATAEALGRAHCAPVPPRQAGYALDPAFLASPGKGLGISAGGPSPGCWSPPAGPSPGAAVPAPCPGWSPIRSRSPRCPRTDAASPVPGPDGQARLGLLCLACQYWQAVPAGDLL